MTIIWVAFAALAVGTFALLSLPLFWRSRGKGATRSEGEAAVLRDKLAQVRRDREHGLLAGEEAAAIEAEVGRALIRASRARDDEPARGEGNPALLGLASGAAVALGLGVYALMGTWDVVGQPPVQSANVASAPTALSEHEGSQVSDAITSLRSRLESDPGNAENWHLLARSLSVVEAYSEAAEAYERLIALQPLQIDIRGDYAETLIRAEGGFVGPDAVKAFETVLAHAPNDPRALYYLALRDAQSGNAESAAQGWARILRTAPADATFRPAIQQILDAIVEDAGLDRAALDLPAAAPPLNAVTTGPGPTAADVAAAAEMAPDEQLTMIRGMVERLEARLEEEPGDIDGWLRLARSLSVLGDGDDAVAALERALEANPGNPQLDAALAELVQ